ncbi:bifunctional folylpolyglutamate synthase/dihydrofolate synthase [Urechidicola croceus]|uniref:Dihydrofolate synthase/folylpolyglutamate synthase n=1 Tax=Urechidicola croceus TaxID=1850246 RepID=A0A1D8P6Z0_9FLAO|nr:folylpolyglutamate synthase/dihydrofolate synthase family protein [Urechidicola croceus]AOW20338.1 tetrahydrofolate synthase [Urechidicola croceus]
MKYQETLDWMFSQLPMYQKQGKTAFKKDLSNTLLLSKHLNNPEKRFKSVHVAGTNGKGSTSHMIASILQEAGYKVGLYTSPHLKDFRERIKINGQPISQDEVIDFISDNKSFFDRNQLSFFEMTVGLAFDIFAKHQVDIAVVEVGLGGRLDSTNIITPEVSVITNIGFDHVQMLGNTLPEIAAEKAGIIKKEIPVVIGEFQEEIHHVFYQKAIETHSNLFLAEKNITADYESDLKGIYQKKNKKTAIQAIRVLQSSYIIKEGSIIDGLQNTLKNTGLLGRWQELNQKPLIVCDTAHNKEGLKYVVEQIQSEEYNHLHIVFGVVNDKDLNAVLPLLPVTATYYFCKPNLPRGLNADILQETALNFNLKGKSYSSVNTALSAAKNSAQENDFIFIGGSTFVVAEIV